MKRFLQRPAPTHDGPSRIDCLIEKVQSSHPSLAVLGSAVWLAVAHFVPNLPAADLIRPGEVWRDTDGQVIQAHSAGLLSHEGVFYWYGENKSAPNDPPDGRNLDRVPIIGVSAYSSRDLVHWQNEGLALAAVTNDAAHDLHPAKVCERPKVLFNTRTKQFVMWWHMDSADYLAARAGVAVADRPTGPFRYLRSFRPINDRRFRDMILFQNDDGQAYVFYASEDNATMYVSRLNGDFTDVERPAVEGKTWQRNFPGAFREAPAPFKHGGRYYLITSGCTGWNPNAADLAVAEHPLGPYVSQGNPCIGPNADKTFGAQSTFVLPLPNQPGHFIFLADRWNPKHLRDSRYVWLPFEMAGQPARIAWREAWQPQGPSATLLANTPGRDWSLPDGVRETVNAGWAWCGPDFARDWQKRYPITRPDDELYFCGYKYLVWADVNPAPGQYKWDAVDEWVAKMTAVPHLGFAFYPAVYSRMLNGDQGVHTGKQYMAPHWLETEGWQGRKIRFYKDGEPTGWEPDSGYLGALEAFLKALAERYARNPRFAYIDIRCIDHIYGEGQLQGASTKAKMDDLEKNYGYSPERYEAYMKSVFNLYARLFRGQEGKCVIQTMGPYMAGPPGRYDGAAERAWLYGFSKGFGGRDGMVESWMQYLNLGNGCSVDPITRHLIAEEEWHPVLEAWDTRGQGPVWLTENEEWGADSDRGPKENEVTGWFVSNLRALQMRRNWIGLSSRTVWSDLPMSRYFQLSLGKTRANSPDAWCWLRESGAFGQWFQYPEEKKLLGTDRVGPTNGWLAKNYGYPREYEYLNSERRPGKVINFERWLMQFDTAPDGMTRPTLRTDTFQKAWDRKDRSPDKLWGQSHGGATGDGEFWARRTDHATGQNAIYFKADPKWFQAYTGAARLLVTCQDTNAVSWRLEYQDSSGARQQSPVVTNGNAGGLRTVTFDLPSLATKGGFAGTNDFRLVRLSGGDMVVQFVRLVKWKS